MDREAMVWDAFLALLRHDGWRSGRTLAQAEEAVGEFRERYTLVGRCAWPRCDQPVAGKTAGGLSACKHHLEVWASGA